MIRRLRHDRRGSIATEFALVVPLALTLLLGGMNYGLGMLYRMQLDFAIESAAKAYATGVVTTDDAAKAYARDRLSFGTIGSDVLDIDAGTTGCGKWVSAAFYFDLIKLFPAMTMTAQACYPAG